MIVTWPEAEADQSARIGNGLRLPAVIGLIAAHRVFTRLVPGSRRRSVQIMLANQGQLNFLGAIGINFLLPARTALSLAQRGLPRLALARWGRRLAMRSAR